MREGHASGTALLVAAWRAAADAGLSSVPDFSDPVARHMLRGRTWGFFMERMSAFAQNKRGTRKHSVSPYLDMLALRVAFIDAVISERRPRQVVILGAGLDTRAWRLPALQGVRVFELDHPDTQAYKRERAARLGPPLAKLEFVPIDFTRSQVDTVLPAAGFDANAPTLWVWEGVIMYLDDAALRSTLQAVRRASAPGSTLIAHYHEPSASNTAPLTLVRRLVLQFLSEPQIGLRARATLRNELERAGFRVQEDAGLAEQAARLQTDTRHVRAPIQPEVQISRILVANG